jgi:hypothetical protein
MKKLLLSSILLFSVNMFGQTKPVETVTTPDGVNQTAPTPDTRVNVNTQNNDTGIIAEPTKEDEKPVLDSKPEGISPKVPETGDKVDQTENTGPVEVAPH